MLLLTDCPEAVRALLPESPELGPCSPDELSEGDRRLWACLRGSKELHAGLLQPRGSVALWSRLVVIADAPTSQFDLLRTWGHAAPAPPVATLALRGQQFHGHRGRPWAACEGNIHLCVALSPQQPARLLLPALVMLPAVAVAQTVAPYLPGAERAGIKWVNDVLVAGRKVAGVLTTTATMAETVQSAVLGVGLNVAQAPAITPTPFVPTVGCLAELCPQPPPLGEVLWSLLAELARWHERLLGLGPRPLWEAYCEASLVVGQAVRVYDESLDVPSPPEPWPPPLAAGIVESIEPDLSLRLRGQHAPVTRGRLAFDDACRAFGL